MRVKKINKNKSPLIWRLLKRYLANSSIHGVKYLVEDGRHWSERLFWLLACGLSWWGCAILISGVLTEFQNRRTAITIQTNYIGWPIELPSIHLCSMQTPDSGAYVTNVWKKKNVYKKLDTDRTMGYERNLPEPHGSDIFEGLAKAMKLNCSKLFEWCEWNGKEIDCCSAFRPLATPMGSCLSINSIFTTNPNSSDSDFEMQRFQIRHSKPDSLRVRFIDEVYWNKFEKNYNLYLMGNMEIPSLTTGHESLIEGRWKSSLVVKIDVIQQPIYNEQGVRDVSIKKRNCRFMDEKDENSKIYRLYSYNACVIEADLARMYNICNCISHIYPRAPSMSICNQTQLKCVYESSSLIYNNQYPDCVPDCEATLYTSLKNFKSEGSDGSAHFEVNFLPGPSRRYVRYVVHSKLDVVVSVGGALGLFVGASILSLVEIPYWIFVRGADDDDDDEDGDQVRKEN